MNLYITYVVFTQVHTLRCYSEIAMLLEAKEGREEAETEGG